MLKASLTVLLFLAASHASAQQIVRLQESPLPAESHPVRIDTDRALSVRHLASGEVLDCEGRCLLQMAAGDYALELRGSLIRPPRRVPLTLQGPERLTLRVHSRRAWRILGGIIMATVGLGGAVGLVVASDNPCRSDSPCFRDGNMAIAGVVSFVGFTVGVGMLFTRDRVEFRSAP